MSESQEFLQKRWGHLRKILERSGPFTPNDFEPSAEILDDVLTTCNVLVVGAGGLGCELLKDLALMGFRQIHVIDMDTVELSNLNRQFLFRHKDIGSSKAECAASFINKKVSGCQVVPHFCKIQDYDETFYRQFHIIVCGLDSIVARRWLNGIVLSMVNYDENGTMDQCSIIPIVDGGTEGFKGSARIIIPGLTPCIECTLDLYPPQVTYPLCTIANTPRLPEHCIEYVKVIMWPKENPWGVSLDGDDPQHITWIFEKSMERAQQFNISGLTYRLVQGVIKNIIPAVASTNALIAAICATEVFKLATTCCASMNNYMVFNDIDGIYSYTYEATKKEDCLACSQVPQILEIKDPNKLKLKDLIDILKESPTYQMKSPGLTTIINGKNKTLYMSTIPSIEERTRDNLNLSLVELGLKDSAELIVADLTSPNSVIFKLKYAIQDIEMST